uniref:Uncharacterized protein n=1 Tax=Toxoplasma gondii COUG TaxID=1074873 RepID=A0A2G8XXQ0_TOXGO|nr:hypothetical protein TGCOUG_202070 [Toxoplasma gondii COUG]
MDWGAGRDAAPVADVTQGNTTGCRDVEAEPEAVHSNGCRRSEREVDNKQTEVTEEQQPEAELRDRGVLDHHDVEITKHHESCDRREVFDVDNRHMRKFLTDLQRDVTTEAWNSRVDEKTSDACRTGGEVDKYEERGETAEVTGDDHGAPVGGEYPDDVGQLVMETKETAEVDEEGCRERDLGDLIETPGPRVMSPTASGGQLPKGVSRLPSMFFEAHRRRESEDTRCPAVSEEAVDFSQFKEKVANPTCSGLLFENVSSDAPDSPPPPTSAFCSVHPASESLPPAPGFSSCFPSVPIASFSLSPVPPLAFLKPAPPSASFASPSVSARLHSVPPSSPQCGGSSRICSPPLPSPALPPRSPPQVSPPSSPSSRSSSPSSSGCSSPSPCSSQGSVRPRRRESGRRLRSTHSADRSGTLAHVDRALCPFLSENEGSRVTTVLLNCLSLSQFELARAILHQLVASNPVHAVALTASLVLHGPPPSWLCSPSVPSSAHLAWLCAHELVAICERLRRTPAPRTASLTRDRVTAGTTARPCGGDGVRQTPRWASGSTPPSRACGGALEGVVRRGKWNIASESRNGVLAYPKADLVSPGQKSRVAAEFPISLLSIFPVWLVRRLHFDLLLVQALLESAAHGVQIVSAEVATELRMLHAVLLGVPLDGESDPQGQVKKELYAENGPEPAPVERREGRVVGRLLGAGDRDGADTEARREGDQGDPSLPGSAPLPGSEPRDPGRAKYPMGGLRALNAGVTRRPSTQTSSAGQEASSGAHASSTPPSRRPFSCECPEAVHLPALLLLPLRRILPASLSRLPACVVSRKSRLASYSQGVPILSLEAVKQLTALLRSQPASAAALFAAIGYAPASGWGLEVKEDLTTPQRQGEGAEVMMASSRQCSTSSAHSSEPEAAGTAADTVDGSREPIGDRPFDKESPDVSTACVSASGEKLMRKEEERFYTHLTRIAVASVRWEEQKGSGAEGFRVDVCHMQRLLRGRMSSLSGQVPVLLKPLYNPHALFGSFADVRLWTPDACPVLAIARSASAGADTGRRRRSRPSQGELCWSEETSEDESWVIADKPASQLASPLWKPNTAEGRKEGSLPDPRLPVSPRITFFLDFGNASSGGMQASSLLPGDAPKTQTIDLLTAEIRLHVIRRLHAVHVGVASEALLRWPRRRGRGARGGFGLCPFLPLQVPHASRWRSGGSVLTGDPYCHLGALDISAGILPLLASIVGPQRQRSYAGALARALLAVREEARGYGERWREGEGGDEGEKERETPGQSVSVAPAGLLRGEKVMHGAALCEDSPLIVDVVDHLGLVRNDLLHQSLRSLFLLISLFVALHDDSDNAPLLLPYLRLFLAQLATLPTSSPVRLVGSPQGPTMGAASGVAAADGAQSGASEFPSASPAQASLSAGSSTSVSPSVTLSSCRGSGQGPVRGRLPTAGPYDAHTLAAASSDESGTSPFFSSFFSSSCPQFSYASACDANAPVANDPLFIEGGSLSKCVWLDLEEARGCIEEIFDAAMVPLLRAADEERRLRDFSYASSLSPRASTAPASELPSALPSEATTSLVGSPRHAADAPHPSHALHPAHAMRTGRASQSTGGDEARFQSRSSMASASLGLRSRASQSHLYLSYAVLGPGGEGQGVSGDECLRASNSSRTFRGRRGGLQAAGETTRPLLCLSGDGSLPGSRMLGERSDDGTGSEDATRQKQASATASRFFSKFLNQLTSSGAGLVREPQETSSPSLRCETQRVEGQDPDREEDPRVRQYGFTLGGGVRTAERGRPCPSLSGSSFASGRTASPSSLRLFRQEKLYMHAALRPRSYRMALSRGAERSQDLRQTWRGGREVEARLAREKREESRKNDRDDDPQDDAERGAYGARTVEGGVDSRGKPPAFPVKVANGGEMLAGERSGNDREIPSFMALQRPHSGTFGFASSRTRFGPSSRPAAGRDGAYDRVRSSERDSEEGDSWERGGETGQVKALHGRQQGAGNQTREYLLSNPRLGVYGQCPSSGVLSRLPIYEALLAHVPLMSPQPLVSPPRLTLDLARLLFHDAMPSSSETPSASVEHSRAPSSPSLIGESLLTLQLYGHLDDHWVRLKTTHLALPPAFYLITFPSSSPSFSSASLSFPRASPLFREAQKDYFRQRRRTCGLSSPVSSSSSPPASALGDSHRDRSLHAASGRASENLDAAPSPDRAAEADKLASWPPGSGGDPNARCLSGAALRSAPEGQPRPSALALGDRGQKAPGGEGAGQEGPTKAGGCEWKRNLTFFDLKQASAVAAEEEVIFSQHSGVALPAFWDSYYTSLRVTRQHCLEFPLRKAIQFVLDRKFALASRLLTPFPQLRPLVVLLAWGAFAGRMHLRQRLLDCVWRKEDQEPERLAAFVSAGENDFFLNADNERSACPEKPGSAVGSPNFRCSVEKGREVKQTKGAGKAEEEDDEDEEGKESVWEARPRWRTTDGDVRVREHLEVLDYKMMASWWLAHVLLAYGEGSVSQSASGSRVASGVPSSGAGVFASFDSQKSSRFRRLSSLKAACAEKYLRSIAELPHAPSSIPARLLGEDAALASRLTTGWTLNSLRSVPARERGDPAALSSLAPDHSGSDGQHREDEGRAEGHPEEVYTRSDSGAEEANRGATEAERDGGGRHTWSESRKPGRRQATSTDGQEGDRELRLRAGTPVAIEGDDVEGRHGRDEEGSLHVCTAETYHVEIQEGDKLECLAAEVFDELQRHSILYVLRARRCLPMISAATFFAGLRALPPTERRATTLERTHDADLAYLYFALREAIHLVESCSDNSARVLSAPPHSPVPADLGLAFSRPPHQAPANGLCARADPASRRRPSRFVHAGKREHRRNSGGFAYEEARAREFSRRRSSGDRITLRSLSPGLAALPDSDGRDSDYGKEHMGEKKPVLSPRPGSKEGQKSCEDSRSNDPTRSRSASPPQRPTPHADSCGPEARPRRPGARRRQETRAAKPPSELLRGPTGRWIWGRLGLREEAAGARSAFVSVPKSLRQRRRTLKDSVLLLDDVVASDRSPFLSPAVERGTSSGSRGLAALTSPGPSPTGATGPGGSSLACTGSTGLIGGSHSEGVKMSPDRGGAPGIHASNGQPASLLQFAQKRLEACLTRLSDLIGCVRRISYRVVLLLHLCSLCFTAATRGEFADGSECKGGGRRTWGGSCEKQFVVPPNVLLSLVMLIRAHLERLSAEVGEQHGDTIRIGGDSRAVRSHGRLGGRDFFQSSNEHKNGVLLFLRALDLFTHELLVRGQLCLQQFFDGAALCSVSLNDLPAIPGASETRDSGSRHCQPLTSRALGATPFPVFLLNCVPSCPSSSERFSPHPVSPQSRADAGLRERESRGDSPLFSASSASLPLQSFSRQRKDEDEGKGVSPSVVLCPEWLLWCRCIGAVVTLPSSALPQLASGADASVSLLRRLSTSSCAGDASSEEDRHAASEEKAARGGRVSRRREAAAEAQRRETSEARERGEASGQRTRLGRRGTRGGSLPNHSLADLSPEQRERSFCLMGSRERVHSGTSLSRLTTPFLSRATGQEETRLSLKANPFIFHLLSSPPLLVARTLQLNDFTFCDRLMRYFDLPPSIKAAVAVARAFAQLRTVLGSEAARKSVGESAREIQTDIREAVDRTVRNMSRALQTTSELSPSTLTQPLDLGQHLSPSPWAFYPNSPPSFATCVGAESGASVPFAASTVSSFSLSLHDFSFLLLSLRPLLLPLYAYVDAAVSCALSPPSCLLLLRSALDALEAEPAEGEEGLWISLGSADIDEKQRQRRVEERPRLERVPPALAAFFRTFVDRLSVLLEARNQTPASCRPLAGVLLDVEALPTEPALLRSHLYSLQKQKTAVAALVEALQFIKEETHALHSLHSARQFLGTAVNILSAESGPERRPPQREGETAARDAKRGKLPSASSKKTDSAGLESVANGDVSPSSSCSSSSLSSSSPSSPSASSPASPSTSSSCLSSSASSSSASSSSASSSSASSSSSCLGFLSSPVSFQETERRVDDGARVSQAAAGSAAQRGGGHAAATSEARVEPLGAAGSSGAGGGFSSPPGIADVAPSRGRASAKYLLHFLEYLSRIVQLTEAATQKFLRRATRPANTALLPDACRCCGLTDGCFYKAWNRAPSVSPWVCRVLSTPSHGPSSRAGASPRRLLPSGTACRGTPEKEFLSLSDETRSSEYDLFEVLFDHPESTIARVLFELRGRKEAQRLAALMDVDLVSVLVQGATPLHRFFLQGFLSTPSACLEAANDFSPGSWNGETPPDLPLRLEGRGEAEHGNGSPRVLAASDTEASRLSEPSSVSLPSTSDQSPALAPSSGLSRSLATHTTAGRSHASRSAHYVLSMHTTLLLAELEQPLKNAKAADVCLLAALACLERLTERWPSRSFYQASLEIIGDTAFLPLRRWIEERMRYWDAICDSAAGARDLRETGRQGDLQGETNRTPGKRKTDAESEAAGRRSEEAKHRVPNENRARRDTEEFETLGHIETQGWSPEQLQTLPPQLRGLLLAVADDLEATTEACARLQATTLMRRGLVQSALRLVDQTLPAGDPLQKRLLRHLLHSHLPRSPALPSFLSSSSPSQSSSSLPLSSSSLPLSSSSPPVFSPGLPVLGHHAGLPSAAASVFHLCAEKQESVSSGDTPERLDAKVSRDTGMEAQTHDVTVFHTGESQDYLPLPGCIVREEDPVAATESALALYFSWEVHTAQETLTCCLHRLRAEAETLPVTRKRKGVRKPAATSDEHDATQEDSRDTASADNEMHEERKSSEGVFSREDNRDDVDGRRGSEGHGWELEFPNESGSRLSEGTSRTVDDGGSQAFHGSAHLASPEENVGTENGIDGNSSSAVGFSPVTARLEGQGEGESAVHEGRKLTSRRRRTEQLISKVQQVLQQIDAYRQAVEVCGDQWRVWQDVGNMCRSPQGVAEVIRVLLQHNGHGLARTVAELFTPLDPSLLASIHLSYLLHVFTECDDQTTAVNTLLSHPPREAVGFAFKLLRFSNKISDRLLLCSVLLSHLDLGLTEKEREEALTLTASLQLLQAVLSRVEPHHERVLLQPRLIVESLLMNARCDVLGPFFQSWPDLRDDGLIVTYARKALCLHPPACPTPESPCCTSGMAGVSPFFAQTLGLEVGDNVEEGEKKKLARVIWEPERGTLHMSSSDRNGKKGSRARGTESEGEEILSAAAAPRRSASLSQNSQTSFGETVSAPVSLLPGSSRPLSPASVSADSKLAESPDQRGRDLPPFRSPGIGGKWSLTGDSSRDEAIRRAHSFGPVPCLGTALQLLDLCNAHSVVNAEACLQICDDLSLRLYASVPVHPVASHQVPIAHLPSDAAPLRGLAPDLPQGSRGEGRGLETGGKRPLAPHLSSLGAAPTLSSTGPEPQGREGECADWQCEKYGGEKEEGRRNGNRGESREGQDRGSQRSVGSGIGGSSQGGQARGESGERRQETNGVPHSLVVPTVCREPSPGEGLGVVKCGGTSSPTPACGVPGDRSNVTPQGYSQLASRVAGKPTGSHFFSPFNCFGAVSPSRSTFKEVQSYAQRSRTVRCVSFLPGCLLRPTVDLPNFPGSSRSMPLPETPRGREVPTVKHHSGPTPQGPVAVAARAAGDAKRNRIVSSNLGSHFSSVSSFRSGGAGVSQLVSLILRLLHFCRLKFAHAVPAVTAPVLLGQELLPFLVRLRERTGREFSLLSLMLLDKGKHLRDSLIRADQLGLANDLCLCYERAATSLRDAAVAQVLAALRLPRKRTAAESDAGETETGAASDRQRLSTLQGEDLVTRFSESVGSALAGAGEGIQERGRDRARGGEIQNESGGVGASSSDGATRLCSSVAVGRSRGTTGPRPPDKPQRGSIARLESPPAPAVSSRLSLTAPHTGIGPDFPSPASESSLLSRCFANATSVLRAYPIGEVRSVALLCLGDYTRAAEEMQEALATNQIQLDIHRELQWIQQFSTFLSTCDADALSERLSRPISLGFLPSLPPRPSPTANLRASSPRSASPAGFLGGSGAGGAASPGGEPKAEGVEKLAGETGDKTSGDSRKQQLSEGKHVSSRVAPRVLPALPSRAGTKDLDLGPFGSDVAKKQTKREEDEGFLLYQTASRAWRARATLRRSCVSKSNRKATEAETPKSREGRVVGAVPPCVSRGLQDREHNAEVNAKAESQKGDVFMGTTENRKTPRKGLDSESSKGHGTLFSATQTRERGAWQAVKTTSWINQLAALKRRWTDAEGVSFNRLSALLACEQNAPDEVNSSIPERPHDLATGSQTEGRNPTAAAKNAPQPLSTSPCVSVSPKVASTLPTAPSNSVLVPQDTGEVKRLRCSAGDRVPQNRKEPRSSSRFPSSAVASSGSLPSAGGPAKGHFEAPGSGRGHGGTGAPEARKQVQLSARTLAALEAGIKHSPLFSLATLQEFCRRVSADLLHRRLYGLPPRVPSLTSLSCLDSLSPTVSAEWNPSRVPEAPPHTHAGSGQTLDPDTRVARPAVSAAKGGFDHSDEKRGKRFTPRDQLGSAAALSEKKRQAPSRFAGHAVSEGGWPSSSRLRFVEPHGVASTAQLPVWRRVSTQSLRLLLPPVAGPFLQAFPTLAPVSATEPRRRSLEALARLPSVARFVVQDSTHGVSMREKAGVPSSPVVETPALPSEPPALGEETVPSVSAPMPHLTRCLSREEPRVALAACVSSSPVEPSVSGLHAGGDRPVASPQLAAWVSPHGDAATPSVPSVSSSHAEEVPELQDKGRVEGTGGEVSEREGGEAVSQTPPESISAEGAFEEASRWRGFAEVAEPGAIASGDAKRPETGDPSPELEPKAGGVSSAPGAAADIWGDINTLPEVASKILATYLFKWNAQALGGRPPSPALLALRHQVSVFGRTRPRARVGDSLLSDSGLDRRAVGAFQETSAAFQRHFAGTHGGVASWPQFEKRDLWECVRGTSILLDQDRCPPSGRSPWVSMPPSALQGDRWEHAETGGSHMGSLTFWPSSLSLTLDAGTGAADEEAVSSGFTSIEAQTEVDLLSRERSRERRLMVRGCFTIGERIRTFCSFSITESLPTCVDIIEGQNGGDYRLPVRGKTDYPEIKRNLLYYHERYGALRSVVHLLLGCGDYPRALQRLLATPGISSSSSPSLSLPSATLSGRSCMQPRPVKTKSAPRSSMSRTPSGGLPPCRPAGRGNSPSSLPLASTGSPVSLLKAVCDRVFGAAAPLGLPAAGKTASCSITFGPLAAADMLIASFVSNCVALEKLPQVVRHLAVSGMGGNGEAFIKAVKLCLRERRALHTLYAMHMLTHDFLNAGLLSVLLSLAASSGRSSLLSVSAGGWGSARSSRSPPEPASGSWGATAQSGRNLETESSRREPGDAGLEAVTTAAGRPPPCWDRQIGFLEEGIKLLGGVLADLRRRRRSPNSSSAARDASRSGRANQLRAALHHGSQGSTASSLLVRKAARLSSRDTPSLSSSGVPSAFSSFSSSFSASPPGPSSAASASSLPASGGSLAPFGSASLPASVPVRVMSPSAVSGRDGPVARAERLCEPAEEPSERTPLQASPGVVQGSRPRNSESDEAGACHQVSQEREISEEFSRQMVTKHRDLSGGNALHCDAAAGGPKLLGSQPAGRGDTGETEERTLREKTDSGGKSDKLELAGAVASQCELLDLCDQRDLCIDEVDEEALVVLLELLALQLECLQAFPSLPPSLSLLTPQQEARVRLCACLLFYGKFDWALRAIRLCRLNQVEVFLQAATLIASKTIKISRTHEFLSRVTPYLNADDMDMLASSVLNVWVVEHREDAGQCQQGAFLVSFISSAFRRFEAHLLLASVAPSAPQREEASLTSSVFFSAERDSRPNSAAHAELHAASLGPGGSRKPTPLFPASSQNPGGSAERAARAFAPSFSCVGASFAHQQLQQCMQLAARLDAPELLDVCLLTAQKQGESQLVQQIQGLLNQKQAKAKNKS